MSNRPEREEEIGDAGPSHGSLMESARRLWLAGMGALATLQAEGGRLFATLVEEGERLERRTKQTAAETVEGVRETMAEVKGRADEGVDRLERVFEGRVARALNRLGVPNAREVAALTQRVEDLDTRVRALMATRGASDAVRQDEGHRDNGPDGDPSR